MSRYFAWDPELETGFDMVDAQHKTLFSLANELERVIGAADAGDAVADAVYGLVGYVVEHFADEERVMAAYRYPGLVPHRALHEQLNATTLDIVARYTNGEDLTPDTLGPVVCDWLTTHIELHDKTFVTYVHGVERARTSAGEGAHPAQ